VSDANKSNPKVVLLHPGAQHSRYLADELWDAGLLTSLCTSLSANADSWLGALLHKRYPSRIVKRVPQSAIKLFPISFISARLKRSLGLISYTEYWYTCASSFQKSVPTSILSEADIIVGFDTSSWILAERAKSLGKIFILDATAVPHASLFHYMKEAYGESPEVSTFLPAHSDEMLAAYKKELHLADYVVHASSFTKSCLTQAGVKEEKLIHIPYGVSDSFGVLAESSAKARNAKVRFVFVGSLSPVKGVSFLLEAFKQLNSNCELHFIGSSGDSDLASGQELSGVFFHGKVSHEKLPELLSEMDVLVLPSIVDGFGMVVLEAMKCALPVIVSEQVGASDLVTPGKNGIIVEAGDSDALAEAMRFFITESDRIKNMGLAARESVANQSWKAYGAKWVHLIKELIL